VRVRAPRSANRSRRPGRPPAADTSQRERLLDAALECYSRDGVAATSARGIAVRAGVTPALVNYYFGGKEQLLGAVTAERLLPALGLLREGLAAAGDDARAIAAAFVRGLHAVVGAHPWLPALWVREVVTEGGALRGVLIEQIFPLIPVPLAQRFAAAQRAGGLGPDVDPRLLVVSLLGLTMLPLATAPIWRRAFGADDVDDATLVRHTLALLEHGIGGSHEG
jgi:AcrR family transcriptional regulator